uniref:Cyclin-dependent kinases regulatory subunit n=1 Tax=Gouania willdenowi TaxID=441366 RepID=A0A8C5DG89_GOUWI
MSHKQIYYSDKYDDEKYEYRHVMLPKDIAKRVPKTHLMSETEWRNLGVQQSQGWVVLCNGLFCLKLNVLCHLLESCKSLIAFDIQTFGCCT